MCCEAVGKSQQHFPEEAPNFHLLRDLGIYEEALLDAFSGTKSNYHHWGYGALCELFTSANRKRLRAAGDPLPGPGPFTLYRGVAGTGKHRRVRGLSWTASKRIAYWFATRYDRLDNPAVFEATVPESDILAYTNDRDEHEFIFIPPKDLSPRRLKPSELPFEPGGKYLDVEAELAQLTAQSGVSAG